MRHESLFVSALRMLKLIPKYQEELQKIITEGKRKPGHVALKVLYSNNRFFCAIAKFKVPLILLDYFFLLVRSLLLQLMLR